MSMLTALRTHHAPRLQETYVYVRRKNTEKHSREDRLYFHDSYPVSRLEILTKRADIETCDFWATAAEYHLDFRTIREKTVTRERDGKTYEETRRETPRREKWIDAIQLNFLTLKFKDVQKSEPTAEEVKVLINERCEELSIPKPVIVDAGDGTYELRWVWSNVMKNSGERNNPRIKYPRFNIKFDEMQSKLYSLFEDLGADPRQLKATAMLRVVGTPTTKTGRIVRIISDGEAPLTYQELGHLIDMGYARYMGEVIPAVERKTRTVEVDACREEELSQQVVAPDWLVETLGKSTSDSASGKFAVEQMALFPEEADISVAQESHVVDVEVVEEDTRSQSEIGATLSRELGSLSPSSPIAGFLTELAKYTDFELLYTKKAVSDVASSQEVASLPAETEAPDEQESPDKPETLSGKPSVVEGGTEDLLRLHPCGENYACLCTLKRDGEGNGGKWEQHWTLVSRLLEKYEELRQETHGFAGYDVYVSQLEFKSATRTVENVAGFNVCFVDIDGELAGDNLTAEERKEAVLIYCREKSIPEPSEVMYSGNGVHLKYFFKEWQGLAEFSRWERLERKLYELFKAMGADSHATDGARVLRVEGTQNWKPGTKDRYVRIVFRSEDYDFDEFAGEIEALLPEESNGTEISSSRNKREVTTPKAIESESSEHGTKKSRTKKKSVGKLPESVAEDEEEAGKTWLYVEKTGQGEFVARSDLRKYLGEPDEKGEISCSIVEYKRKKRADRAGSIENIYLSYVILPCRKGMTKEGEIGRIRDYCREYRGIGIPAPNQILQRGHELIAIWRYAKEESGQELPGCALSRWKAVQEFLCHHFGDSREVSEIRSSKQMLPLAGYSGVRVLYDTAERTYTFDDVARVVLPFSQAEVKKYKAEKKPNRSIALEDLTKEYVLRRKKLRQSSKFSPALKIFNDIVKILRIRAEANGGEVPEGCRELSVFFALNFAITAGLIRAGDKEEFNELAEKLIEKCGPSFKFECTAGTYTTLKKRFLVEEEYKSRKVMIIERLGITPEEQKYMSILKELPVRPPKMEKARVPIYEKLRVSKSKYHRDRRKAREISQKLREIFARLRVLSCVVEEMRCRQRLRQMALKKNAYYEGGSARGIKGVSESVCGGVVFDCARRKRSVVVEEERPPPEGA